MFGSQRFGSQNPFGGPSQGSQPGGGTATTCRECGSDAVDEHDGVYVCSVCGLQSQDLFVEETEWQAGVNTGEGRHLRRRRERRVKAAPVAAADPRDVALAYAECLQCHLVALCDALAGAHQLQRQALLGVATQLWTAYLPLTDVFRSTGAWTQRKARDKAAAAAPASGPDGSSSDGSDTSSSSSDGSDSDTSSDEDNPGAGGALVKEPGRRNVRLRTELHARLPLVTPLAIAYLAALWLRAPVVHTDVIRGCLDGTLPWLGFHATLPGELTAPCPVGALIMTSVPAPRVLHVAAAAIAHATGMQCPPVNAASLAERFAREMALPPRAGKEAATLLVLHEPPGLWLGAPPGTPGVTHFAGDTTPATHVMAALLFVLKAVYRLGEPPRAQEPTEPTGPESAPEAAPETDPESEPEQEAELEPEPSEPDREPEPAMASDEEYKYDMPMLDSSSGDEGGDVSADAADEAEALPKDDEAGADEEEEDQQPVQKPVKAKKLRCGKRCKNGCQRHMCPCFRVRCAPIALRIFRHTITDASHPRRTRCAPSTAPAPTAPTAGLRARKDASRGPSPGACASPVPRGPRGPSCRCPRPFPWSSPASLATYSSPLTTSQAGLRGHMCAPSPPANTSLPPGCPASPHPWMKQCCRLAVWLPTPTSCGATCLRGAARPVGWMTWHASWTPWLNQP